MYIVLYKVVRDEERVFSVEVNFNLIFFKFLLLFLIICKLFFWFYDLKFCIRNYICVCYVYEIRWLCDFNGNIFIFLF